MKTFSLLGICCLLLLSFSMVNPVMAQKKAVKNDVSLVKVPASGGQGKVRAEKSTRTGYQMVDALNEAGTKLEKVAYKWFAGDAEADNKSVAIEMALSEARAEVSRSVLTIAKTEAERGALTNNGKVQQALKTYWNQVSMSVQKGCEPFGDAIVVYNKKTGMYQVRAKVGMRGDLYKEMLRTAGQKPTTLSGEELREFEEINASIINAAKAQ